MSECGMQDHSALPPAPLGSSSSGEISVVTINVESGAASAAGSGIGSPPLPPARRSKAQKFKQELKAEFTKVKRSFSHQIKKTISWRPASASPNQSDSEIESVMAARARRRQQALLDRTKSAADKALKGLRFVSATEKAADWSYVESNFKTLAHEDGFLYRADFAKCIGMEKRESEEFALELFDALCRRRGTEAEKINQDELYEYWSQITNESFDSRLHLFFDMVDKNEDGRLSEEELTEIIRLCASTNRLSRLREQAEEYAALIMEDMDPERLGYIELWQLEHILLGKNIYLSHSHTFGATSKALGQYLRGQTYENLPQRAIRSLLYFLQKYWKRIWFLSFWILVMTGLFTWKFIQYKHKSAFKVMGYCLTMAKGAAETLKLNMALILFPVCRNTVTWLRTTCLSFLVPFNDNINFHMTIATAVVIGSILHVGNHLSCDFVRLERSSAEDYKLYLSSFGVIKPTYGDLVRGYEGITGIIMVFCMAVAFTLAMPNFRRGHIKLPKPFDRVTGFNAFWYTHHLFVIVYICLFIHGIKLYLVHTWYRKTTWMYLAVPVLLYAGERTLRMIRSCLYSVHVLEADPYDGKALKLKISKPPQFHYKSGQYMFLQCPAVSPFEWHPFSITSAPDDDFLSFHIRCVGDWTKTLWSVFEKASKSPTTGDNEQLPDEGNEKRFPKLLIDGPYGAPAQDYRAYDVLILVGLGIGATPFISILKDLLNKIVRKEEEEARAADLYPVSDLYPVPNIDVNSSQKQKKPLRTTKAYFYWATGEQASFDWFKGVMDEVAELDQRGIIEMHNHLTSIVYDEGDARTALITMIAALNHAKNGVDAVSGTKVRAHFGRPKWEKELSKIGSKHPNARVGVFYCGHPAAAKDLKRVCDLHNQRGATKFEFHKENF